MMKQQSMHELQQYLIQLEKDVDQLREEKSILKETNQTLQKKIDDLIQEKEAIIGYLARLEEKENEYDKLLEEREGELMELRNVLGEYEVGYKQLERRYYEKIRSRCNSSHNNIIQSTALQLLSTQILIEQKDQQEQRLYSDQEQVVNHDDNEQKLMEFCKEQIIQRLEEEIVDIGCQVSKYQHFIHSHHHQSPYRQQQQHQFHMRQSISSQYTSTHENASILMNQLQLIEGYQSHQVCLTTSCYRLLIEQRHKEQTQRSIVSANEYCSVNNNSKSSPHTQRNNNCMKQQLQIINKNGNSYDNIADDNQQGVVKHIQKQLERVNKKLFMSESKLLHTESRLIEMQQCIDQQTYLLQQTKLQLTDTQNQLKKISISFNQQTNILMQKQQQSTHLHQTISQNYYLHQLQLKQTNQTLVQIQGYLLQRDQFIAQLNKETFQKDIIIMEQNYIIKDKDSIIKLINDAIVEKDHMISELHCEITQLQSQLQSTQLNINHHQQQVAELKTSHSQYSQNLQNQLHKAQQLLLQLQKRDKLVIEQIKRKIIELMQLVERKDIYIHQRQQSHALQILQLQTHLKEALGNTNQSNIKLNKNLSITIPLITGSDTQSTIVSPSSRRQKLISRTSNLNPTSPFSTNRQLVFLQNAVTKQKQEILSLYTLLKDKDIQIQSLQQIIKSQGRSNQRQRELVNSRNLNFIQQSVSSSAGRKKQPTMLSLNQFPSSPINKFIRTKVQTKPKIKRQNSPSTTNPIIIINSNSNSDLNNFYRQKILPRYLSPKKNINSGQKTNN